MLEQKFGYSFNEQFSGNGVIEYTDTQAYPKVTFKVTADHAQVKQKIISYLSTPRRFYVPSDVYAGGDNNQVAVAPNVRIDFFQAALREMNAAIGVATQS